jgi:phage shock protein PspC (stress-responsive transcriptional regulator)
MPMILYDEITLEFFITLVFTLIGIVALYVIARMLINRHKGRDEMDGLL